MGFKTSKMMGKAQQHADDESTHGGPLAASVGEKDFEILFRENFHLLCGYCIVKFKFDDQLAREMVHAGFIKFWETRHIQGTHASAKGYLYTIIINNCVDYIRHRKVRADYERHVRDETQEMPVIDNAFEVEQLRKRIERTVAALPEQMRKVFQLSRYEGLKYRQIAQLLGISVKTVETQMSRALGKLKEQLGDLLVLLLLMSVSGN
jgi:RNA polymerase sigma-70 factor (ECF subfamily)